MPDRVCLKICQPAPRPLSVLALCLMTVLLPLNLAAEVFQLLPGEDVVGAMGRVSAVYEDTLIDIGRRNGVGYTEITAANPEVDVWLPGIDTPVVLPTRFVLPAGKRRGLVVNIAEYRVYYYPQPDADGQRRVSTFPISIGRMDWETPLGRAAIVAKAQDPAWYPPESIRAEHAAEGRPLPRIVPAGPDNPLGRHALRLSVPGYLIHGTNRPAGVGMRVTHGCIRMYPEDIAWLFPQVTLKTPVELVNQPYKMGWSGDQLLLEVHTPLTAAKLAESEGDQVVAESDGLTVITQLYVEATAERAAVVDWDLIEQVYRQQRGIPIVVGRAVVQPAEVAARAD